MSQERLVILSMMGVNGVALYLIEQWSFPSRMRAAERRQHIGPNLLLTGLLLALNVAFDRVMAAAGGASVGETSGLRGGLALPGWASVLVVVVVLDGLTYLAHVLMHKLPPAWRFHRVHHFDAHVDVTTAFRQHPLETVWRYAFFGAGVAALRASNLAVAVYLGLSALNAQLEHADVALPWRVDRWLRLFISTPAMHRVHHSRAQAETDTNYSNIFSFWDRLFGTYRPPVEGERILCGLDEFDAPEKQRAAGLLALPFDQSSGMSG
jgi:sterol desaturase/sphingolipid hydroxylase (fatty acid hydroxylase superfamily)